MSNLHPPNCGRCKIPRTACASAISTVSCNIMHARFCPQQDRTPCMFASGEQTFQQATPQLRLLTIKLQPQEVGRTAQRAAQLINRTQLASCYIQEASHLQRRGWKTYRLVGFTSITQVCLPSTELAYCPVACAGGSHACMILRCSLSGCVSECGSQVWRTTVRRVQTQNRDTRCSCWIRWTA